MMNPDKFFHDSLYNLETNLSDKVSFEEVMSRRGKSNKGAYIKPVIFAITALVVATLSGVFLLGNNTNVANAGNSISIVNNSKDSDSKLSENQNTNPKSKINVNSDNATNKINENSNLFNPYGAGAQGNLVVNGQSKKHNRTKIIKNAIESDKKWQTSQDVTVINHTNSQDATADVATTETYVSSDLIGVEGIGLSFVEIDPVLRAIYPFWLDIFKNHEYKQPLPLFTELSISTGGSRYKDYQSNVPFSVRGNHYFSQYNAIALVPVGSGLQAGAGFSYSEYAGVGDWRSYSQKSVQQIDTQIITIVQPGLPNKYITIYDTTDKSVTSISNGTANYKLNRIGLPIAMRYYLGNGKALLRIAATVTPGILIANSGQMFNSASVQLMDAKPKSTFTLDAQLGIGMYYNITRKMAVIAEPNINWQNAGGRDWASYNRTGAGLTVGLILKVN